MSSTNTKKLSLAKTHDFCATKQPKLTVVFIHGLAIDSTCFDHTLKYLEGIDSLKTVRFITLDLLGSGKSYANDILNYDYQNQLEALHSSITSLNLTTPLILVGHSMGAFIVTRYADTYEKSVDQLILLSPPIYTIQDLENPAFATAIKIFKNAVSTKNRQVLKEKSFNNSIDKIVLDKNNYKTLVKIKIPTTLVYGDADQFIASYNIPKILTENPQYLSAVKTTGRHGISHDKYSKVAEILERILNA